MATLPEGDFVNLDADQNRCYLAAMLQGAAEQSLAHISCTPALSAGCKAHRILDLQAFMKVYSLTNAELIW